MDEPSSVERLWEEFKLKASADARERLILHYSPLVKYVAGRVGVGLPPNIEQADLVSYGIFGLIDAIEKFDLERAHQVRDLRDQPHPRRDHRRAAGHRLDPALGPLQGPRGREGLRRPREPSCTARPARPRSPSSSASRSTTCTRSSARSRSSTSSRSTSCSRRRREGRQAQPGRHPRGQRRRGPGGSPSSPRRPSSCWPRRSTGSREREKIVVTLYYYEGLTLAEIGQVLGVTESRICQMHTKAVLQLRAKMQDAR